MSNPLLSLPFEPSIESLGDSYWDVVEATKFPLTKLRFRNDALLEQLGVKPNTVKDQHFEEAFGAFKDRHPLLALRYHGYQFGNYNPLLGDGRGFLYAQIRDRYGKLQDLGTKGSGQTPWSRGGDGKLTLKGGIREIIASEALKRLGVNTSRILSLIETGEKLWRGDEPSPTRSSVMVRMAHTHLRFGTCERLLYLRDQKLIEKLLRHIVLVYYPSIQSKYSMQNRNDYNYVKNKIVDLYSAIVENTAKLAAEWMGSGFTHGVLNTDNMSLVGESFDYGPFAFIEEFNYNFTAAYFDQTGLYCYGNQPAICHDNLQLLQEPFAMIIPRKEMVNSLGKFPEVYKNHYENFILRRLGFPIDLEDQGKSMLINKDTRFQIIKATLELLSSWKIEYGEFFTELTKEINTHGLPYEPESLNPMSFSKNEPQKKAWTTWRDLWWHEQNKCQEKEGREISNTATRLKRWNLPQTPTRKIIEQIWNKIEANDNWEPFEKWLEITSIS